MAKTKKEIQEQNSEEKQDGITAGLIRFGIVPRWEPACGHDRSGTGKCDYIGPGCLPD